MRKNTYFSVYTTSVALGVAIFSSASTSMDDYQDREMIMIRPSPYCEMRNKDISTTDVCLYLSSHTVAPKVNEDNDDSLVWLPIPPVQRKLTKNFHFLGKKKYKTVIHPDFFA